MSQEQTKGMTPDQRRAWRQTERQKLIAMSDTDRQKFKADLQARWDLCRLTERTASSSASLSGTVHPPRNNGVNRLG